MSPVGHWPARDAHWSGYVAVLWGKPPPASGTLSLHSTGLWQFSDCNSSRLLRLAHVWPAFAWVTLSFRPEGEPEAKRLELTVWKAGMPRAAWCALRVNVARQAAMPGRALERGIQ